MLTYPIHVAGLDRELPICKVSDDLYIGAFICFGDAELTEACARELLRLVPAGSYDYLFTAEAKSIPLIHEMARQSGRNEYLLARKAAKAYMDGVFSVKYTSITTQGSQELFMDGSDAKKMAGKRVLILDDVISTGESLAAMEHLVKEAGGIIVGKMAVLAEGGAAARKDIIYLEKLPLFDGQGTPLG